MSLPANLFTLPRLPVADEVVDALVAGAGLRIERIISCGQTTPPGQWYDQGNDEWVALLQGEAELAFDDGSHCQLAAGDHLFIPAHRRHRVAYTSVSPPCVWLAVHLPAGLARPSP